MNNHKFNPIRSLSKLFSSSQSRSFEQHLKAQAQAEAYYKVTSITRF